MKNVKFKSTGTTYSLLNFTFYPLAGRAGILTFTFILCLLMILPSCNKEKILFTELAEIGADGWAHRDSIRFAFTANDTSQFYNLKLEITHGTDYAWENVYVQIKTAFPGDSLKTDVLSLELSDGAGGWAGKCSSGGKCRLTIPLQRHLKFPHPGDYALTFAQYMRQEVVPGIHGLRLTVSEAEGQAEERIKGSTDQR